MGNEFQPQEVGQMFSDVKRDETIKNLDLPLGKILRKRIINKVKKFTSFFK